MRFESQVGWLGLLAIMLSVLSGIGWAQDLSPGPWQCIGLLDEQTQNQLAGYERFVAESLRVPQTHTESDIQRWLRDIQSCRGDAAVQAAACLGNFKITQARQALEVIVQAQGGDNRIKWAAARSLGLIGDKQSVSVLIGLVDHFNANVRVYARVSLAEITGVYFGEDKQKWQAWLSKQKVGLVLCAPTECNIPPGASDPLTSAAPQDSQTIYIVAFRPRTGATMRTGEQLLEEFNKKLPGGANTHHYRPSGLGSTLAGRICVDGEAGKNALVEMLAQSETLILVSAKPATQQELADLGITAGPAAVKPPAPREKGAARVGSDTLSFNLRDISGRQVLSEDYVGVPVLVMAGSCWCGGCQQDAEPLRRIAEEYESKGLAVIRSVAGDNELASLEFQRHYRLKFPHLLDTDRGFEKQYNTNGWTFLMLTDGQGKIVYRCNSPKNDDWSKVRTLINGLLTKGVATKAVNLDGTYYMPATLQRSGESDKAQLLESFTSIACGRDDKVYLVFTTNRNNNNDVCMRVFDGNNWSQDIPVAATTADEFDGTAAVDKKGTVWVSWTSNAGGNYDIYTASLDNRGEITKPSQVTRSDDDAMHGRMACDSQGRMWIAYYKWRKMGQWSRDKEVYVRNWRGSAWSDEVQVSPTDVPEHEDHTEPAIAAYRDGAIVCWNWDFHQPAGYTKDAEFPTVFARTIDADFIMSKAIPISAKNIDVTPAIAAAKNRVWLAWDSQDAGAEHKFVCARQAGLEASAARGQILNISGPTFNICTPALALSATGTLALVWSETVDGQQWVLKRAELNPDKNIWSLPETIASQGDPRYCSATYDANGRLWIAYSERTDKGRRVKVVTIDKPVAADLFAPSPRSGAPSARQTSENTQAVEELRRLIDEHYSYRDLRGVNWQAQFERYGPLMERASTNRRFAEHAAKMLEQAKDTHLWVKIDGETIGGFKRQVERNYDIDVLCKTVPQWRQVHELVYTGRFDNGIGYIMIKGWSWQPAGEIDAAFAAVREFENAPGLIIDVRPNSGGAEPLAQEFAGCFIDKPAVYAKHKYRDAESPGGWGNVQDRQVGPNPNGPAYHGKVAVLMGQVCMSSNESFLLMMRQIPNCKLIGEKSYGSSGNPKEFKLPNGVSVWLPSWQDLLPDGTCLEGKGVTPDITVRMPPSERKDFVLERALQWLRRGDS